MKEAPFKELPVAADTTDPEAIAAARKQLQGALDQLVGKTDSAPQDQPKSKRQKRALRQGPNNAPAPTTL